MRTCENCGKPIPHNGRRRYCCPACKQAAFRKRATPENGETSRTSERATEKPPYEAAVSPASEPYRNARYSDTPDLAENSTNGASALWLGWAVGPDLAGDLDRAIRRFQEKPAWGGARPDVVRACPAFANDGLKPAAEAAGLRVIADARIQPKIIYLALGGKGDEQTI
jgi:hypothetical protein